MKESGKKCLILLGVSVTKYLLICLNISWMRHFPMHVWHFEEQKIKGLEMTFGRKLIKSSTKETAVNNGLQWQ